MNRGRFGVQETDAQTRSENEASRPRPDDLLKDYPVREYIAALATELAQMARFDGDESLGASLDVAASLARRPG